MFVVVITLLYLAFGTFLFGQVYCAGGPGLCATAAEGTNSYTGINQQTSLRPMLASPGPNGTFPRIASLWWGEYIYAASPSQAAKIQLFLAPGFTAGAAQAVRASAPGTPILGTINAEETVQGLPAVPDSYYLKDVRGNKIQTWPGTPGNFLLNLTNPAVVQFLAQYASQQLTQGGFTYDGMFFDNVTTTISNVTADCFGNPIQIDSNGDGLPDNPTALDAAWSAGIYNLMATFRQLSPNVYVSGHINQLPPDPRSLAVFNGDSLVFDAVNVREGTLAFGTLWNTYQQWFAQGQSPVITAVQSSPPSQIAYGYGYTPLQAISPSTALFGQTFYPNMRFGLALALMNNGFFIHDFGDVSSPVAWWYDEYDFGLGSPVTPALTVGAGQYPNEVVNGGFESSTWPWQFSVWNDGSASASMVLDNSIFVDGTSSAHVSVAAAGTADYHVDLEQGGLALTAGVEYQVQFWAKADSSLSIGIATQGAAPAYAAYGLDTTVTIGMAWNLYSVSFVAPVAATDCRLEFRLGGAAGNIWLDDVQLTQAPIRIYRRDFTNGVVLLNGTTSPQTISLESGLQRFTGSQAPRYQYIVDDADAGFTASGSWTVDTFDTGSRVAYGPYYHAWKSTCHELDVATGSAQWSLAIPADGQYTVQVWLPAAPASGGWTKNAVYEVVSGSQVVATTTLDQTAASAGDQWFTVANLNLTAASAPYLRVHNGGSGALIADAVYVYSSSDRYNDGSPVSQVTLAPMDGILIQRKTPNQSIAFAPPGNQTLGVSPFPLVAAATSGLPVGFTSTTPSNCLLSGNAVTLAAAGTCSITATQPGNASWTAAVPVTQTFTVFGSQTIAFAALPNQTLGSAPLTLIATATSGLPVAFSSSPSSVCSVSGNTVMLIGGGTCSVTASQPGNAIYSAATPVARTFNVFASQTITFAALGIQALGTAPFPVSAVSSSGLPVGIVSNTPSVCTVSGSSLSLLALGACSLTASQPGNAGYAAAAPVTQSFTVTLNLIANGGFENSLAPWQLNVTPDGQANASAALDTGIFFDGKSSVQVDVTAAATADWHVDLEQGSIALTAGAAYQVRFRARADSPRTIDVVMQGGAPSYSSYGLYTTTAIGTTWNLYSASFVAPANASDGRLEFWLGNMAGNIWLDDVQIFGTAGVNQTIIFAALTNQTVLTPPFSIAAAATSGLTVAFASGTPSVCTVSGNTVTPIAPGTCTITASQAGNGIYNPAPAASQSFAVTLAPQTILFPMPGSVTLGAAPFPFTASASSGLPVSYASNTTSICTISGNTATLIAAGTCSITASQSGNSVYSPATPVTQTFTVNKSAQSIAFGAPATQALGGGSFQISATATSGLPVGFTSGTTPVCTVSGINVTPVTAGTCSITASQPGNANYNAATSITQSFSVMPNLVGNGGFENGTLAPWSLLVTNDGQSSASVIADSTSAIDGAYSARIGVASSSAVNWHIDFEQGSLTLVAGQTYKVQFWARADSSRPIEIFTQGGPPSFAAYGLDATVPIGTGWSLYSAEFVAQVNAQDARLEFWCGSAAGNIWLDDVQLFALAP
jgi:hypothetical protein